MREKPRLKLFENKGLRRIFGHEKDEVTVKEDEIWKAYSTIEGGGWNHIGY
jgi:hypothetical protein